MKKFDNIYSANDITHYCIWYCNELGNPISNMQVQRILYYIQGGFLVKKNRPCFSEEITAWTYGAVIESVYYRLKGFGKNKIVAVGEPCITFNYEEDKLIVERICEVKSKLTSDEISKDVRNEDPWKQHGCGNGKVITKESIKKYFKGIKFDPLNL